jgi:hypothetical protein
MKATVILAVLVAASTVSQAQESSEAQLATHLNACQDSSKLSFTLSGGQLGLGFQPEIGIKPSYAGSVSCLVKTPRIQAGLALDFASLHSPGSAALFTSGYDHIYGEDGMAARRSRLRASAQLSPSIRISVGRDTLHDGYGIRSLFRGRHAAPAPFAQTEIDGGRITYRHRIEALSDVAREKVERIAVSQRIELQVRTRWKFALWGAVIWPVEGGSGRGFEPHYLVPIASFRPTEYAQGSSDNAMVGGEFRFDLGTAWAIAMRSATGNVISILPAPPRYLYGQFVLDELVFAHLAAGDSWWGNQWGLLGGLHWGLMRGHIQAELAAVRPYTYAHTSGALSWIHGETPLAHPLGGHFVEANFQLVQRRNEWSLALFATASLRGENGSSPVAGDDARPSETAPWFDGSTRRLNHGWIELSREVKLGGAGDIISVFATLTGRQTFVDPTDRNTAAGLMIGLRSGTPLRPANW